MQSKAGVIFRKHFYNALFVVLLIAGAFGGGQLWGEQIIEQREQESVARAQEQLSDYREKVRQEGKNAIDLTERGYKLLQRQQIDYAIVNLELAAQLDAHYRDAHLYLGYAYLKKDLLQEAKQSLDRALEIDPINSFTHELLGIYWEKSGNPEKAQEHFDKAKKFEYEE